MKKPDLIEALDPVVKVFQDKKIPYYIGGSVASSAYGFARATMDIDMVADIKTHHVSALAQALENEYYISPEAATEAVKRKGSFNLIHYNTMMKIDIFILKNNSFDISSLSRKRLDSLDEDFSQNYYISSAEDIILAKMVWYKKGGCINNQQIKDVAGILKVQKERIDKEYLKKWAQVLEITDLLDQVLKDSKYFNKKGA